MATSGSKSIAVTSYDTMTISWTCDSQSTANNTSTCTFKAQLISTSSGRISSTASKSYTATVNGTEYTGTNTVGIAASSTLTLWSKTITIAHDSDGSKSFTFSFAQTFAITFSGTYIGTVSASCTVELPTIARASSITSAAAVTLGNAVSVKWTPASSAFAYKLKFTVGSGSYTTGYISPGSTSAYTYTGYTMTIATWAPYITSATSATCTVTLYTYSSSSSSTAIGTATKTFTVTVPSSVVPTLSSMALTLVNSNSAISGWGLYVKGYSKVTITASASGIHGSTISKYTYTITGFSSASNTSGSYTSSAMNTTGTVTITCYATDSRGRNSATSSTTITVYDYYKPTLSSVSLYRSDADGVASDTGAYIYAKATANIASVNGQNSYTMSVAYRAKGGSYGSATEMTSGTGLVIGGALSYASTYEAKITLTDAVGNAASVEMTIPTDSVGLNFRDGGDGASFGGYAEEDDLLDVRWNGRVRKNLTVDGAATVSGFAVPTIQSGYVDITAAASSVTTKSVTFPTAFSNTPRMFFGIKPGSATVNYGYLTVYQSDTSATGVTICAANAGSASLSCTIQWMAVLF